MNKMSTDTLQMIILELIVLLVEKGVLTKDDVYEMNKKLLDNIKHV
jgi:hypothetical protein